MLYMKQCSKCKKKKDLSEFYRDKTRKNGYHPVCKVCKNAYGKKYYHTSPERQEALVASTMAKRKRNQEYVYNFLKTQQCIDCGDVRWQVLEFDHVRGTKIHSICHMTRSAFSLETLQAEMDKCEVRCASCHRLKTANQYGWAKAIETIDG